jgi:hypothetical protein
MIGEGDCGAIGEMKISRGNRSTQRKPAPASLCPPQIPLDQTQDQTRAAVEGSQRLTAWPMARPHLFHLIWCVREVAEYLDGVWLLIQLSFKIRFLFTALWHCWALASDLQCHRYFIEGRTIWMSDHLVSKPLPKHRTTQTQNRHIFITNIHALCGIQTHNPGFRVSKDSTRLRPLGYGDWLKIRLALFNILI